MSDSLAVYFSTAQYIPDKIRNATRRTDQRSGMKPKVRAAELNAEPELFQFKANITYLINSKAQKYHILRKQHHPAGDVLWVFVEQGNVVP